ncbi:hypothetical protein Poly41_65330 [Novipirellula artificiosorum]|uniref:Transposase n=1 Tax=Novipirellula artificiosorum TaxID=2528016 RepID=A0A5C6D7H8_9BACT|nr:hypothetical protein Poly41_65330 [Novipirellula artificiosorum]
MDVFGLHAKKLRSASIGKRELHLKAGHLSIWLSFHDLVDEMIRLALQLRLIG